MSTANGQCHKRLRAMDTRGITIVEVLVAMAILSIVSTMLFEALGGSQRIRARGMRLQAAATLAENELELIHRKLLDGAHSSDTAYQITYRNHRFFVSCTQVSPAHNIQLPLHNESEAVEMQLSVGLDKAKTPLVSLRLLHGGMQ